MANDPYLTPVTWMTNTAATMGNLTVSYPQASPAPLVYERSHEPAKDEDEYAWLRRRVKEVEWAA